MTKKASVLTIGTELTTGEIVNRNAAWISRQLVHRGLEVVWHLTVPDEESMIQKALKLCAMESDELFITGGLGPTSDDITRDMVSKFTGRTLELNESAYKDLKARYLARERRLIEGHRHQCHFPQTAELFTNTVGTAHGFVVHFNTDKRLWVLPGPPRELETIWTDHIDARLKSMNLVAKSQLFTWTCQGLGESELADRTEEALRGAGFQLGYRASIPNVIIKVWVPREKLHEREVWFQKLEKAIGIYVIDRHIGN